MESFNGYLLRSSAQLFLSTNGLNFIKAWEGWRPDAYLDSAKNPTIGYGHKICDAPCDLNSPEVVAIERNFDESEATALLKKDVAKAEAKVRSILGKTTFLTQGMYDALVSLTYNTGGKSEWKVFTLTKARAYSKAAHEFLDITRAGHTVVHGLERRRRAESETYLRASYRGP